MLIGYLFQLQMLIGYLFQLQMLIGYLFQLQMVFKLGVLLLFQKIFEIFVSQFWKFSFKTWLPSVSSLFWGIFELLVKIINNCNSFICCLRLILYLLYILQIHIMATRRCPHSVNILGYADLLIYHKRFLSSDSFSKVWRLCIWLFSVN